MNQLGQLYQLDQPDQFIHSIDLESKIQAILKEFEINPKNTEAIHQFITETAEKNPQEVIKIYDYIKEKFSTDSIEYEKTIESIEDCIKNNVTKSTLADLFLKDKLIAGYADDYLHLWHLRKLDMQGDPESAAALDYFINSDKQFPPYYAEVMFIAMRHNLNITNFIENLCIIDTNEFVNYVINLNNAQAGQLSITLNDYLKESPFIQEVESIKCLRIVAHLASALAGDNLDLFEASIRIQHKHLKKIYRENIYCESTAASLLEHDGFTYFAGRAFECKDAKDTAGFARNLRMAIGIMPSMKDIITLLGEKIKSEEGLNQGSVHDKLAQETGKIKSIIYTMINTGNMVLAAQVLDGYAQANPADPEIEKIRAMVEEGTTAWLKL